MSAGSRCAFSAVLHLNMVSPRAYLESACYRKWLGARRKPNHVLCDGHWLGARDNCCVKFLPEDADTAAASVRTTIDDARRAQIEEKLAACPEPGAIAVCRICKGLARKTPQQVRRHLRYMRLPERAEEILWHLRYWYVRKRYVCWRAG